jgi:hypothetical protein
VQLDQIEFIFQAHVIAFLTIMMMDSMLIVLLAIIHVSPVLPQQLVQHVMHQCIELSPVANALVIIVTIMTVQIEHVSPVLINALLVQIQQLVQVVTQVFFELLAQLLNYANVMHTILKAIKFAIVVCITASHVRII